MAWAKRPRRTFSSTSPEARRHREIAVEALHMLGHAMPKGFTVRTHDGIVQDAGFRSEVETAGEERAYWDPGTGPEDLRTFVQSTLVRCLIRIAHERRRAALVAMGCDPATRGPDWAYLVPASCAAALHASDRDTVDLRNATYGRPPGMWPDTVGVIAIGPAMMTATRSAVSLHIRKGGDMPATMDGADGFLDGRRLHEVVGLPPTGRPEVDGVYRELTVHGSSAAHGIRFEVEDRSRVPLRPVPDGVDASWATLVPDAVARMPEILGRF